MSLKVNDAKLLMPSKMSNVYEKLGNLKPESTQYVEFHARYKIVIEKNQCICNM